MCDGDKSLSVVVGGKAETEEQTSDSDPNVQQLSEMEFLTIDESTEKCSVSEKSATGQLSLIDIPVLPMLTIVENLPLKDRMSLARTCKTFWNWFGHYAICKEYVNVRSELWKLFPGEMNQLVFRSSHSLSPWVKKLFSTCNPAVVQCIGFGRDVRSEKRVCLTYLDKADLEEWFLLLPTSKIVGLEMDHCILDYDNVKLIANRCRNLKYFRFSEGGVTKELLRQMRNSVNKVLKQFSSGGKKLGCKIKSETELNEKLSEFVNYLTYYMPNLTQVHFIQ